ncbi:MAG: thiamine transporter permease, partial [Paenibacillus sp.]|nr:thiamine transporter permease [Paenibacillus sp.]
MESIYQAGREDESERTQKIVAPYISEGPCTGCRGARLSQATLDPDAIVIDQSAVGVSTRSNPATYTGIMDDVRKAFASANKVNQGLFSFNSKGACENCQGLGVVYTDLAFLDSVKLPCEVCGGRRFK